MLTLQRLHCSVEAKQNYKYSPCCNQLDLNKAKLLELKIIGFVENNHNNILFSRKRIILPIPEPICLRIDPNTDSLKLSRLLMDTPTSASLKFPEFFTNKLIILFLIHKFFEEYN